MYGMGKFCLATELPDDFGSMFVPFVYKCVDNYGNGVWHVDRWPDWYMQRNYFYCG